MSERSTDGVTGRNIMKRALLTLSIGLAAALAWAHFPAPDLPADARADRIVVAKRDRTLALMDGPHVLKTYRIALGRTPLEHKMTEGDGRTPEGQYLIDYRKADSAYHRALHISYPDAADQAQAQARGVNPGGLIMIHGIRNGLGLLGRLHRLADWTNGCVAVTNTEIEEIWRAVPDGTPIEILP